MEYKRKTEDQYHVEGNFGKGFVVVAVEKNYRAAKQELLSLREKQPQVHYRLVPKRVPIEPNG